MGNCCSVLRVNIHRRSSTVNRKHITLLMVGLDGAGKTTIVKRLSGEPLDSVVSTVGFSTASIQQKGCVVKIFDLGGGPQIRGIWSLYYNDAHGIVFVVDASDVHRIEEVRKVLQEVLKHKTIAGKPVLLLANKQDVEGALDEIDIVEKLNVEPLVNQQKCPTLVELCSARHFLKKMDIGIDNGYKWLIRCIIKDYPTLNNRVLIDLAAQAERDRIDIAAREERVRKAREGRILEEGIEVEHSSGRIAGRPYQNGIAKHLENMENFHKTLSSIPGVMDDDLESTSSSGRARSSGLKPDSTRSSEFSRVIKSSESNIELLKYVGEDVRERNFLIRPKSSGAKLYPSKSDSETYGKKKKKRRKGNKTGPGLFTDISEGEHNGPIPKVFDPTYYTDVSFIKNETETPAISLERLPTQHTEHDIDIFTAKSQQDEGQSAFDRRKSLPETYPGQNLDIFMAKSSKSTPSSRKGSSVMSSAKGTLSLPPLQVNGKLATSGVLLDPNQLETHLEF